MSDVMLLGVLRMPMNYPFDELTHVQVVARCRQAADRIESDKEEIAELKRQLEEVQPKVCCGEFAACRIENCVPRLQHCLAEEQKNAERMRVAIIEMYNDWQKGDFSLSTLAQCDFRSAVEAAITSTKPKP